jgi:hypothetical protein
MAGALTGYSTSVAPALTLRAPKRQGLKHIPIKESNGPKIATVQALRAFNTVRPVREEVWTKPPPAITLASQGGCSIG